MENRSAVLQVPGGLLLKEQSPEDDAAFFRLIRQNLEHLSKKSVVMAEKYPDFKAVLNSVHNPYRPEEIRFGIWVEDALVGGINMLPLNNADFFLSFWIGEKDLGKAYAGKASKGLIEAAFDNKQARVFVAEAAKTNSFAIDILERLGFTVAGETKYDLVYVLERWVPFHIHSKEFKGVIDSHKFLLSHFFDIFDQSKP